MQQTTIAAWRGNSALLFSRPRFSSLFSLALLNESSVGTIEDPQPVITPSVEPLSLTAQDIARLHQELAEIKALLKERQA